jgi:hypothetical protein
VGAPGSSSGPVTVRLEADGDATPWFPWATVAADDVSALARSAGLREPRLEAAGGRWFARAVRP